MVTDSYRDKENNVEVMSHIQYAVTSKGKILSLKKTRQIILWSVFWCNFFFNFEEF